MKSRRTLASLLPVALGFAFAASSGLAAEQPAPFPVKLIQQHVTVTGDPSAVLTYRTQPGLSFCVSYVVAGDSEIAGRWGRAYQNDRYRCLIAGKDGTVNDTVKFYLVDKTSRLYATITTIDDRFETSVVPMAPH